VKARARATWAATWAILPVLALGVVVVVAMVAVHAWLFDDEKGDGP